VGWGRVYADCLLVTESTVNPPLQIWVLRSQIRFFGVIGGVGAGLCRLFVGDRINDEPAPTNLGFTIANSALLLPIFPPLRILQLLPYFFHHLQISQTLISIFC